MWTLNLGPQSFHSFAMTTNCATPQKLRRFLSNWGTITPTTGFHGIALQVMFSLLRRLEQFGWLA
jgi:hypothetical protein